ncbi:hypothetical protein AbHV_ORF15 [Abalone herpesvirus Victoria/AUS/2009]|uniref:Uncharacterized protein n=1 Tax=Abalone herpesvirus (isolate Abalone/Australia/Victoria/2009) TaxID=1241371 RepID=K4JX24_ABHV|nr:hypothetical protein AbHV_ORF15 [Abalone herpesvirus Victoria/AUS/2009]AFU90025.1 hypothetical protein AbHV_ORF15 [Abalone herpesvirus Victoria/AUS/2009]
MSVLLAEEFKPVVKHALYRNHSCSCELCEVVDYVIRLGTGLMIREELLNQERRYRGSNVVGVKMAELSHNMASNIMIEEPSYPVEIMPEGTSETINIMRMKRMLREDFPGVDLMEHLWGDDLNSQIGVYSPFLRHGNQLYSILKILYANASRLPQAEEMSALEREKFILRCCILSNIVVPNPSWLWGLSCNTLETDLTYLKQYSLSAEERKPEKDD